MRKIENELYPIKKRLHKGRNLSNERFICEYCKLKFRYKNTYLLHLNSHKINFTTL